MPQSDDEINEYVDSIIHAKANATLNSPQSSTKRIPKVRGVVSKADDYEKYYVPKVVSIGPYHYRKEKLQPVQNLKPLIAEKIFKGERETVKSLYEKLLEREMVKDLRSYYEEDSTTRFSDKEFTNMMVLDSCFILYYFKGLEDIPEIKSNQIVLAHQDLFLLENQIPFKVITQVAQVMKISLTDFVKLFISKCSIGRPWKFEHEFVLISLFSSMGIEITPCYHLLHLLHNCITNNVKIHMINDSSFLLRGTYNYRNVSELVDAGIHFKPSGRLLLTSVWFSKGWLRFSANVGLPRITVNDSTKYMLLNMIAYETCLCSIKDAWITSYVCFLDSLIDNPQDVKSLRKSWVLDTSLGSDEEVEKLFNEIGTNLVPNYDAYFRTRLEIQKHYESWSNTAFSQLKNEYFKSPWAIFVLLGALLGLLLTAVQTYSALTGECDNLCKSLKKNHHL